MLTELKDTLKAKIFETANKILHYWIFSFAFQFYFTVPSTTGRYATNLSSNSHYFTRCSRKVMRLIFYLPKFLLYIKHQCYPLQNSSLEHIDGDVVPTFGSSAGSLQLVWSSACLFVPPGQTVNQVFYKDILERLQKRVICKTPETADKWMFHHDNAPCHTALYVTEFFTSKDIPVVPQPPIHWHQSLWFLPKLKMFSKDAISRL